MSISLLQFNITGDCQNIGSGEVFLKVTGDTPPFAVSCISPSCPLPSSGLTAPYEYYYSGLTGGTYFLEITDGGNASIVKSVYISSGTTATIDSAPTTCGFDNGSITGFTSGVYGFTTFQLYDGDDTYITSATSVTTNYNFTSLSAGTYYIVANDGGGCTGVTASVIINPSNPFTFGGYVVDDASCLGPGSGKIFLTGLTSPISAYTLTWGPSYVTQTGATITGLTAGTYSATITNSENCTDVQLFTVNEVLPITSGGFIVISQPTCFQNDGEVEFIVLNGTPPYFFSASTGQVEITFGSSVNFTGLTSGSYSFLVTDAGLCTIYESVSLLTPNSFTSVAINTTNSICSTNAGIIQVLVDNGLSSATNLQVSISGSTGIQQTGTLNNSNQFFYGLSNGTYLVTVSSIACTYTATTSINSTNLYTISGSTTGTTCGQNNGVLQVTVSTGGTLPYSFTLVGPSYNPTSNTTPVSTFTNLKYGNYTLTVQDSGIPACVQTIPIFIDNSQSVFFNLIPTQPVIGNDGSITAFITSGEPPFTYVWSGGTTGSQTGSTVTGLTAGTYSCKIIDADGCVLTKYQTLIGTKKYSNYRYYNVCSDQFENSGMITKRDIKSMYLEGFTDLTSGDTNCIINEAIFSIYAQIGSQSAQTEFYVSTGATDYPSDQLWADTIIDTIDSFDGVSGTTIDIISNRITITTTCEEVSKNCTTQLVNPLQDNQVIVNLVIDYDISCVSCYVPTPTPTPTITLTPTPTITLTPTPTPTPTSTPPSPSPFITVWSIDTPGISISLPYYSLGTYSGTIDWGDGNTSVNSYANRTHTYSVIGDYTVTITGTINPFGFNYNTTSRNEIISVLRWGDVVLSNVGSGVFRDCVNLNIPSVIDIPNLSSNTNLNTLFWGCVALTTVNNINSWDVSNVTTMILMFASTPFNQDISSWDVSNVTDIRQMFAAASSFNQDLGLWDVSNVDNMYGTFLNSSFNQDIGIWNVSGVTNMESMFSNTPFNQDISSWDVSNVNNISNMFFGATSFNQDIGIWNVSGVTTMSGTFLATPFNQNIGSWDVSSVTTMASMFNGASSFNQNIGSWDVSSVINMTNMFRSDAAFNQDLSSWDVSSVTSMNGMFSSATSFNQDLSGWCVTLIPSIPPNFASGAISWVLPKPIWGTCPP